MSYRVTIELVLDVAKKATADDLARTIAASIEERWFVAREVEVVSVRETSE